MATHRYEYGRFVTFAETDMAGIMHFANFFRLMEEAEHALFRSVGLSVHPGGEVRTGWPRVHVSCDFHRPLRFEDEVVVEVLVEEVRSKAVRYLHRFWTVDGDGVRVLCAQGRVTAVCVQLGDDGRPMKATAVPDDVRAAIEAAPPEAIGEVGFG